MADHGQHPVGTLFQANPMLRRLCWVYALVWLAAALSPSDRETWLLENGLVFLIVGLLIATHRRFTFSNFSYAMLAGFLVLHAVGAHYTYSAVPVGVWVANTLALDRNPYDRFVHFAFGLLFAYPLREICMRVVHVHRVWSFVAPPVVVLALSSAYEIIESWAARLVDPVVGLAYVGAQGDLWDGQKDMTLALLGAVVAMVLVAAYRGLTQREPYLGVTPRASRPDSA
jgi:putative membrane protein